MAICRHRPLPDSPRGPSSIRFGSAARRALESIWNGDRIVYTVGIGSCSIAKGAPEVLAACEQYVDANTVIVRKPPSTAPDWMESRSRSSGLVNRRSSTAEFFRLKSPSRRRQARDPEPFGVRADEACGFDSIARASTRSTSISSES